MATVSDLTVVSASRTLKRALYGVKKWRRKPWFPLVLALPLCLLPLLWAEPGTLIQSADYNNPLNAGRLISQIATGWLTDNLGQPSFRETALLFPYLTFWWLGQHLGLSPDVVQRLWFVALFALTFLSLWSLVRVLVPPASRRSPMVAVALAAYAFNPFTLTYWAIGHQIAYLAYAAAPLWLSAFLNVLRTPPSRTSGFRLALISLLFAPAATNPPFVVIIIALPTLFFAILLLLARELPFPDLVRRSLAVLPWLLVLNAWWLIPLVHGVLVQRGYAYAGSSWRLLSYPSFTNPVGFFEFFRGTGYWGLHSGYHGVPYFAWSEGLQYPVVEVATVWLGVCVFLPFLRKRLDAWTVLAGALFLVGVFLTKGVNAPVGEVNRWLYLHVPGFFMFRSTEKFTSVQFLGLVIALLVLLRNQQSSATLRGSFAALTACAIVLAAWPMFDGSISEGRNRRSGVAQEVRLPPYYDELLAWTEAHKPPGAILSVPQGPNGYLKTTWGFAGADVVYHYSASPVVVGEPEARPGDGPRFATFLEAAAAFDQPKLLYRLGISHVLVRYDVDPAYYPGTLDPEVAERRIRSAGFARVATIGPFHLYETPHAPSPVRGAPTVLVPATSAATSESTARELLSETTLPIARHELGPGATRGACVVETVALAAEASGGQSGCNLPYGPVEARFLFRRFVVDIKHEGRGVEIDLTPSSGPFTKSPSPRTRLRIETHEPVAAVRIGTTVLAPRKRPPVASAAVPVYPETTLTLVGRARENLIGDGSFEAGLWGGVAPIGRGRNATVRGDQSSDRTTGKRSAEVVARGQAAYISRLAEAFDPASLYEVAFDYKHVRGSSPAFGVWQRGAERYALENRRLSSAAGWHHYQHVLIPDPEAKALRIFLYAFSSGNELTVNRYDNVVLRKLPAIHAISLGQQLGQYFTVPSFTYRGTFTRLARAKPLSESVDDSSFEESLWNGAFPVGLRRPRVVEATHSQDAAHGQQSLELIAEGGGAAVSHPIDPFERDALYEIAFDYKHVDGKPPAFGIWEAGAERYAAKDFSLSTAPGWHRYKTVISPDAATKGLHVFFYSFADQSQRTVNRYDNVRVSVSPLPARLLLLEGSSADLAGPVVRIQHKSGSLFEGMIRGVDRDGWIILAQDFDPRWRLQIRPVNDSSGRVADHVRVDEFANAWHLEGHGDFYFRIAYSGSRELWEGFLISILGFVLGLGGLMVRKGKALVLPRGWPRNHPTRGGDLTAE